MNKPHQLFVHRMKENWKRQYRASRTVIDDWTVALYFIVPALLYCIGYYVQLWNNTPSWVYQLPPFTYLLFLLITVCIGSLSYHFQLADQLFLVQRKEWLKSLQRYSMIYSLLKQALIYCFFTLLWLPILKLGFEMPTKTILTYYALTVLFSLPYMVLKKTMLTVSKAWRQLMLSILWLALGVLFFSFIMVSTPAVHISIIVLLITINVMLIIKQSQRSQRYFLQYAKDDLQIQSRLTGLVMMSSKQSVQQAKSRKSTPIVFRKSNTLFKKRSDVNILVESCIKVFCRDFTHVGPYLQLYSFAAVAMMLLPNLTSYVVFIIILGFTNAAFSRMIWSNFAENDFIKLFNWPTNVIHSARQKMMILLAIPGHLFIVVILALKAPSFAYGVLSITACIVTTVISVAVSMVYSEFASNKSKRTAN